MAASPTPSLHEGRSVLLMLLMEFKNTFQEVVILRALLIFLSSLLCFELVAADLYVAPSGNDQNPGTKDAPFSTILKASQVAEPGTTIHVAPGEYLGSFQTRANGTAADPVVYVSDTKWGAVIVPPANSKNKLAWDNRGHYVTIKDFKVDGAIDPVSGLKWTVGINVGGAGNQVVGCYVKNIYTKGISNSGGGAGILLDSWYGYGDMHAFNNVVTNIGPGTSHFYQGIYMTATGSIKNNLVFGVKGGAGIHLWHDARNIDVINNTTVGNGGGIVLGGGDFIRATTPADYFNVHNNIVYGNAYGVNQIGSNGTHNTYKNNLVCQNSRDFYGDFTRGKATHSGTIAADPGFVKYAMSEEGDFRLQGISPAIDKGLGDLAPASDFDGTQRPQGAAVDLGAFEFKSVPAKPLEGFSANSLRFGAAVFGGKSNP